MGHIDEDNIKKSSEYSSKSITCSQQNVYATVEGHIQILGQERRYTLENEP